MLNFVTIRKVNSEKHLSGQCDHFEDCARIHQLETTGTTVPHGQYLSGKGECIVFLRMTVPAQSSLKKTTA